jgi:hypothetical protein
MVFVELTCTLRGLSLVGKRDHDQVTLAAGCHALDPITHPDEVARANRSAVELDVSSCASSLGEAARLVQACGAQPAVDANHFIRW